VCRFLQMSAIATKKMGSDVGVQLTFPAVYQSVYASQHRPLQYAPTAPLPMVAPMAGDDFQSHYHAQKKKDADYMARAKVISTRNSDHRMMLSHQNYYGMPVPVLGQRQFANPSNGAGQMESARRDGCVNAPFQLIEANLTGGVLRSAEGQAYGKARLLARIKQLDMIDAEKLKFAGVPSGEMPLAPTTGVETMPTAPSAPVSQNAKIELQLLLKAIIDALMGGLEGQPGERDELSRFTFSDSVRALSLIIRVASSPDTDAEALEDVKAPVDNINQLLNGLTDPDRMEQVEMTEMAKERVITTSELFQRIGEYVDGMMGGINLSPKERLALSKNLVKSLGFTQFARQMEQQRVENRGFYERVARGPLFDARGRQEMDDEDDDDDDDRFDRPAERREDTEQGTRGSTAGFTEDDRQVFGYNSGSWFSAPSQGGRDAPAFLGEERPPLEQLGMVERPALLRPAGSVASRRTRASDAPSAEIRGVYDPVLGARGVEVVRPASVRSRPASAQSVGRPRISFKARAVPGGLQRIPGTREVRVSGRVVPPPPSMGPSRSASVASRRSARAAPAPAPRSVASSGFRVPTRQSELPTTREGFDALARAINERGGIDGKPVSVYSKGKLENIRRNFIRRLGLTGKY